MQKIITLFARNFYTDYLVRNEVVTGAEWVIAGEGQATQKLDGTCCLVKDGKLFKRYEVKQGRSAPDAFIAAADPDPETGKQPGWLPVRESDKGDRWHLEAFDNMDRDLPDGTYELVGPKIQGNAEDYDAHLLVGHGSTPFPSDVPRDFEGLRQFLAKMNVEGIVWHHEDGRMAKIKMRDFGMKRGGAT